MIREVTMYQAVCDGCGRNASQVTDDAMGSVFSAMRNDGETDEYKLKIDKL